MPIVAVGSVLAGLFTAMIAISLFFGISSPLDGFDEAIREAPDAAFRFKVTSVVLLFAFAGFLVVSYLYIRKKWSRPGLAAFLTVLFVFFATMIWGIACAGNSGDRQILIFASIQFLVAGLIIFDPLVALAYFAFTFSVFGAALDLSGWLTDVVPKDLVYLAILDIIVCWTTYGLFTRAATRERSIVKQSQRDELTGAKNRHCLREDFSMYIGAELFIMVCDIDDFKQYNDKYGHGVGDDLLTQFYFALREAYGDECVYRYGGDEFLVVSVEFGEEEFRKKARKVSAQLAHVKAGEDDAKLTYSGGYVCGLASDNAAFRKMLHEADENLLEAKRTGKNRIVGEAVGIVLDAE